VTRTPANKVQIRRNMLYAVAVATALVVGTGLHIAGAEPASDEIENRAKQKETELNQIKAYLDLHYSKEGMRWDVGPTRIIADAVTKAYKNRTFYYVHSSQFPIAMVHKVSACLSIDGEGNILAWEEGFTGNDRKMLSFYNDSLMEVEDRQSATLAGTAIMCLIRTHAGPRTIKAEQAKVTRTDDGWTCKAALGKAPPKPENDGAPRPVLQGSQHLYRVTFDNDGKCIETDHRYTGMLPICFGGLFLPIKYAPDVDFKLRGQQGAVVLISMEQGSVAEKSGLHIGDVIYEFDGQPLQLDRPIEWLRERVVPLKLKGHESRSVKVFRNGAELNVEVTWPRPYVEKD